MNSMSDDDSDFISKLPKDLREKYRHEKVAIIKKIDTEWSDKSHTDKKNRGIQEDIYHKEILNACIFPFVQQGHITQKFDYSYIRSSPLSEIGVTNVDFLIASKTDGVLLFGEAKGSISNPQLAITQFKKRINAIEENFEYVKRMFPEVKSCEYVLGVPSNDAVEVSKAILRSNANIIVWQINKWRNTLLSLVILPTDSERRKKIMHNNNNLNKSLKDVLTSTAFKTFFHESHPVAKMTLLTSIDKGSENFSFNDVKTSVSDELDNTQEKEISKIAHNIIECATDIGFVKRLDDETYKIQSRYKQSGARYRELKNKWIKKKIDMDKKSTINQKLNELQAQFLARRTTLDNF